MEKVEGLTTWSKFALSVKRLALSLSYKDEVLTQKRFERHVPKLPNLRSLHLTGVRWFYDISKTPIHLPMLETLIVSHTSDYDCKLIVTMITAHRTTLKLIILRNVGFDKEESAEEKKPWIQVLGAATGLRPEAVVDMSAPFLDEEEAYVQLTPTLPKPEPKTMSLSEMFSLSMPGTTFLRDGRSIELVTFVCAETVNTGIGPVSTIFGFEKYESYGLSYGITYGLSYRLHYVTKAGKLQEALSGMIRDYKELYMDEEKCAAGTFGRICEVEDIIDYAPG
jgi:hypothetical protein